MLENGHSMHELHRLRHESEVCGRRGRGRAAAGDCALMRPVFAYQFSLVQDWKNGSGIMGQQLPRYVPNPPEADRPIPAVMPTLAICVVSDNSLTVPPPIRQEFLTDPTRAPEWRTFLKRFDKMYGTPASFAPAAAAIPVEESSFNWERAFQDDVKLEKDLKDVAHSFPIELTTATCKITEGPKLFVCAGEKDVELDNAKPILCHGQGHWLIDQKASSFLQDSIFAMSCYLYLNSSA